MSQLPALVPCPLLLEDVGPAAGVRQRRERAGMSRRQLAERACVPLSSVERAEAVVPDADLAAIMGVLGLESGDEAEAGVELPPVSLSVMAPATQVAPVRRRSILSVLGLSGGQAPRVEGSYKGAVGSVFHTRHQAHAVATSLLLMSPVFDSSALTGRLETDFPDPLPQIVGTQVQKWIKSTTWMVGGVAAKGVYVPLDRGSLTHFSTDEAGRGKWTFEFRVRRDCTGEKTRWSDICRLRIDVDDLDGTLRIQGITRL